MKIFYRYLAFFSLAYGAGFLAWKFSFLMPFFFLVFVFLFIYLLRKDYGGAILLLFSELLLFSKGNLFNWEGFSLRMAFWFLALVFSLYHSKKIDLKKSFFILGPLALIVFISFVRGYFLYGFSEMWSDANAYFYFLIFFPLLLVAKEKDFLPRFITWFKAGAVFLSFLTLLLLFLFSHFGGELNSELYLFFRKNGLGEITYAGSGFWRIFLQSQIYLLPAFLWATYRFLQKRSLAFFSLATLFLSAIIVSFSRSFWLGLFVGIIILALYNLKNWKRFYFFLLTPLASFLLVLIFATLPLGSAGVFKERSNFLSSESAISSRWQLLPVMLESIKNQAILGHGFGKSLEYKTNDPRVLEYSPEGWYRTSAFEWGYLDIILKMGLLGLLAYFWALWRLSRGFQGLFLASLATLLVIHIFTPYLNHPLGISYLLALYLLRKSSK